MPSPDILPDILERAADRLSKRGAWTQGHYARDAYGAPCQWRSADAVCWCASGAILAEGCGQAGGAFRLIEGILADSVASWNDKPSRRKHQVIRALRDAAAKARL